MNEEIKQAQETLQELSALALKYLINNFHFINEEYVERKSQIANLTEKIKIALNDFYGYKDSQQDLIKGKDEYIAKLCNDRAELKEHEKELIAEQNRLFDLSKKQEQELDDLREFAKLVVVKRVDVYSILMTVSCIEYNERISYYYPSLADKKYLKKLLLTEEEWQFLKKMMRKEEYGKKED